METGLIEELARYCEYLDSDRDYVITQALEIAFRKDKGFARWLTARQDAGTVSSRASEAPPPQMKRRKRGGESSDEHTL